MSLRFVRRVWRVRIRIMIVPGLNFMLTQPLTTVPRHFIVVSSVIISVKFLCSFNMSLLYATHV